MIRARTLVAVLAVVVAGVWFGPTRSTLAAVKPVCINVAWAPGPHHCKPPGYWHAPYTTPYTPICTPLFFGGEPLGPEPPEPETVVRLRPIPTGPPKDQPPSKPITSEPVRPVRPPIDIDAPPDKPPVMPLTAARIHLLTLVDSDVKELGKVHTAGADLITNLLKAGIRGERFGKVIRLGSAELVPNTITQAIKDLEAAPDDTIVVYYAGAVEFDETSMGFKLTPSQAPNKWPREELKKALDAKNVRLVVLLSDSASERVLADPSSKPELPEPGPTVLEKWFFGYKGIVDVHSCSAGEFAAARGSAGGCFTLAFVREFGRPAGSWADMLEGVKFATNNLFKSYRLDVLRSDDLAPAAKATYRNQESQIPAMLTPIENVKPAGSGAQSVPTLTPPIVLTLQRESKPAQLQLRVPAGAAVWIDGQQTAQVGPERLFETSPIETDQNRECEIRMEFKGWVGVYRVALTGGRTTKIELVIPENVAVGQ